MISFISENRYLTRSEMETNAEYIATFFLGNGWTLSAVAAMLGNMESESTINPGIYEDLDSTSTTNGFGLVQWTPNTKYKTWADANGFRGMYGEILGQMMRILYEVENGLQWIPTDDYPMTFTEFTKSDMPVEYLAQAFLYNYERPQNLNQPNRSTQAVYWYDYIDSKQPVTPTPQPSKGGGMSKLLLYFMGTRRR